MRIAIDARTMCDGGGGPGAGIEHYTWSVVFSLLRRFPKDRFLVFVPPVLSAVRRLELQGSCRNVRITTVPSGVPVLGRQAVLPALAYAFRTEVLFVPTPHVPMLWRGPSVVTVHDMAIFTHPEWFPEGDATSVSTRKLVPDSLRRATRLVAVSSHTAQTLEAKIPGGADRTDVVYPGVTVPDHVTASERLRLPGEFVLCLGTVEPRKNLAAAIFAFHRFLSDHPERAKRARLVLAGKWGWKTDDVQSAMDAVNAAWQRVAPDHVVQSLGPVSEEEKWELLSRTSCLLFPSFEEGFGLPALEAMALGVPIVCSNQGALPEVVGDAAWMAPPDDAEQIALLLAQVMLMPEAVTELSREGLARAKQFTWEATADGIREAMEKAVMQKSTP